MIHHKKIIFHGNNQHYVPSRLCKKIILFILFISIRSYTQKTYQKDYYHSGELKEEGWLLNNERIDYWKLYYKNGNIKEEGRYKSGQKIKYWYFYSQNSTIEKEGHYEKGNKSNWWLFYDKKGNVNHKCQLKNNQKNGYCLIYKENEIIKASKFVAGKKVKEWNDFSSFKKENNLFDLR